jgi:pyridoxine/pyridoxamine 5'-phosphate oxidase
MPVWGVWHEAGLWFSSGLRSRKARNLAADPRCSLATDDARHPAVLEGRAERVVDADRIDASRRAVTATYDADLTVDFLDPVVNGTYAVRPARVSC